MIKFELLDNARLADRAIALDFFFSLKITGLPRATIDQFVNAGFRCLIENPAGEPDVRVGSFANQPFGMVTQASDGEPNDLYMAWADAVMSAAASYAELIALGATQEQAASVLPLNNDQTLTIRTRVSELKLSSLRQTKCHAKEVLDEIFHFLRIENQPDLFE